MIGKGVAVLGVMLVGMAAAMFWKPPIDSAGVASWAQAFGTVLAIAGGAGIALYESQLARERDREGQDGAAAMVVVLGQQLVAFADRMLTDVFGAADEHQRLKKFDIEEVGRIEEEIRSVPTTDFTSAHRRLALRKVQRQSVELCKALRGHWDRKNAREYVAANDEDKVVLGKRIKIFSDALERFTAAK